MARPTLDAAAARARALKALARREHSARELEHKLSAEGLPEAEAAALVGQLAEAGWQNDARYAELLIRSRIAQGHGPLRIAAELAARGVAEALIGAALVQADCDWTALAASVRRNASAPSPEVRTGSASNGLSLAGRGFKTEQIRAVLSRRGCG